MVKAYILIEIQAGSTKNLMDSLGESDSVKAIDRVTGPYDAIAVIEAESIEGVSNVVTQNIHSLPGVIRTLTSICVG